MTIINILFVTWLFVMFLLGLSVLAAVRLGNLFDKNNRVRGDIDNERE